MTGRTPASEAPAPGWLLPTGAGSHVTADELALARTHLANERTLLAYARTALALMAGGWGVLEIVDADIGTWVGGGCIVAGVALIGFGIYRYGRLRRILR